MESLIYRLKKLGIGIGIVGDQIKLDIPENAEVMDIVREARANNAALVSYIRQVRNTVEPVVKKPRPVELKEVYELFHQQKKEFLRFLILGEHAFNASFTLSCESLDRLALEKVFKTILLRHEGLRTTFLYKDGSFWQRIHEIDGLGYKIEYIDLVNEENKEALAQKILVDARERRFNFEKEPLFEAKVIHYTGETYFLLFTTHHAICDAFSGNILKREIELLYNAYKEGRDESLAPLKLQCKDYARWVNDHLLSASGKMSREFYKRTITESIAGEYKMNRAGQTGCVVAGLSSYRLQLKTELIRAVGEEHIDKFHEAYGTIVNLYPEKGGFYRTYIGESVVALLREVSLANRSTVFNTLIAAFSILLFKENRNRYIRMSIPYSPRIFEELEAIVGWLTAEIIVCIPVDPGLTIRDFLKQVTGIVLETAPHRFYPHEQIMDDLDIPLHILAPVLFNFMEQTDTTIQDFTPVHHQQGSGHFNIHCKMTAYKNGLALEVNYKLSIYSGHQIERMMHDFACILDVITKHPEYIIKDCLPITTTSYYATSDRF